MLITVFHMHSTVGKEFLREVSTVYNKHWNKYFLLKKINEFEFALSHLSKFNNLIQNININTIMQFQIELQQPINYSYNTVKRTVQINTT